MRLASKGKIFEGTAAGDGPVDACYKAIEKITGNKARLTYYAIQAVTGGKDAQGEVTIKLAIEGRQISGRGTSTDVIEASVKAYLYALNKACAHVAAKSASPI
jgi:2-isopropylmalate synthase